MLDSLSLSRDIDDPEEIRDEDTQWQWLQNSEQKKGVASKWGCWDGRKPSEDNMRPVLRPNYDFGRLKEVQNIYLFSIFFAPKEAQKFGQYAFLGFLSKEAFVSTTSRTTFECGYDA